MMVLQNYLVQFEMTSELNRLDDNVKTIELVTSLRGGGALKVSGTNFDLSSEEVRITSFQPYTLVTPGHVPTTLALRPKKFRGRSENL